MEKLKQLLGLLTEATKLSEDLALGGEHHVVPVYRSIEIARKAVEQRIVQTDGYNAEQKQVKELVDATRADLKGKNKAELQKVVDDLNRHPSRATLIVVDKTDTNAQIIDKIVASGLYRPVKAEAKKPEDSNAVYARLMGKTVDELKAVVAEMNKAEDRQGDIVLEANASKQQIVLAIMQASGLPAPQQP